MQGCPVQSECSFEAAVCGQCNEPGAGREQHHLYCRTGCHRSRHPGVSWAPLIPARGEGMRRSAASRPGIARPCSEYGTLRRHHRTDDCRAGRPLRCQGPLDPLIGPVFNDAVEDWDEHLRTLNAFWSSVMLTSGRYKGNPMAAHLKLPIEPRFFERWLVLWRETAAELFAPDLAAQFAAKAGRIAESLKLALFYRPGAVASARLWGDRRRTLRIARRAGRVSAHPGLRPGHDTGRARAANTAPLPACGG